MADYDLTAPWNAGVRGDQVLPLINDDAPILRVEAGPGTGKTFGLTRRLVRALHPAGLALDGKDCLVVAFNRIIANDLRTEIGAALQGAGIDQRPEVHTVHGLCLRVLGATTRLLLPHEREAMLYDVRRSHDEFGGVSVSELDQRLRDDEAGHRRDPPLRDAVGRWLANHSAMLVSDVPRRLKESIQGGEFSDIRFKHIVVDEYQDLTEVEQDLVNRLRTDDGQLVALGDRNQSIYTFRGNHRLGLANLADYGPVVDIEMTACQRCPAVVVEAANQIAALDGKPMQSASDADGALHTVHWPTPTSESSGLAAAIRDHVARRPDDRHLVMVTRRAFGYALQSAIKDLDADLPVDVSFAEGILERWVAREAFLAFCLAVAPDRPTWRAWLGYQNPEANNGVFLAAQRNSDAYLKLADPLRYALGADDMERLASEERSAQRGAGGSNLWDRARRFLDLVVGLPDLEGAEAIEVAFSPTYWGVTGDGEDDAMIIQDLNLLRSAALESLANARSLNPGSDEAELLRRVADDLRYRIAVREPFDEGTGASIKITTLWGAKGLTADHVYVLGVCGAALPGQMTPDYPGTAAEFLDEQRRLFYVSLTRAKETLVISRPLRAKFGEVAQWKLAVQPGRGYWADLGPSPYMMELHGANAVPDSVPGAEWAGC